MTSKFIAILLAVSLTLSAQDKNYFPKPSYFRETFAAPPISKVELLSPVRLSDYVVAGKLELSLRAYLELVMANNTDIAISRLSVETSKNAILRGYALFDPFATANFTPQRTKSLPSSALDGATGLSAPVSTLNQPLSLNYSQTLMNGTNYSVGFTDTRVSTNSTNALLNPSFGTNLQFNITQPLLRNRGSFINRLAITQARSRLRKSEYDLTNSLIGLISNAELVYWQAIQVRENLKVQESNLDLQDKFLVRSNRELELGAISKLDIYQPQQQFAQAQAQVSQARYQVLQQDDAIRKQIGADLDPAIRALPIVYTEPVAVPADTTAIDAEALIAKALTLRPDLKSATQNLDLDDLQIRNVSNTMRPDLALTGTYSSQGRGGIQYDRSGNFLAPGGFGDSFTQMWGFGYPIYGFGLRLRLPIRNRAASADMADALIQKKRDSLTIRATEQTIRLDILNAVNQVESSKASVELAIKSRDFAQLRQDAEQKKYELGTSQQYLVLAAIQDLNAAESNVISQTVNYRRNVLSLLRVTGDLLEQRGVAVK
jgi:outer membrane protein TolC